MQNESELITILSETAMWWAAFWRSPGITTAPPAPMVPRGEDHFDELLTDYGMNLWTNYNQKRWRQFEKTVCFLASELRFQIFANLDDAVAAGQNVVSNVLDCARYRPQNGHTWEEFEKSFTALLQQLSTRIEKDLIRSVRDHFVRPTH